MTYNDVLEMLGISEARCLVKTINAVAACNIYLHSISWIHPVRDMNVGSG